MCVLDGQMEIYPPVVPQQAQLVPYKYNQLLAHLFNVLTKCQAMQRFEINPDKNHTIHKLLDMQSLPPSSRPATRRPPT